MDRTLRNTIAVLVVTLFTALAIFATVQLTARVTGLSAVSTASTVQAATVSSQSTSGQTMTCPRTGCTATYCHALQ